MAQQQRFSRQQVAERNSRADAVFIVDNVVYNVTPFLDEHPGGHEVLLNAAGRDASEDYADVGHSMDAKELMKKYVIGELVDEDKVEVKRRTLAWEEPAAPAETSFLSSWQFPLVLGLLLTVLYSYLFA